MEKLDLEDIQGLLARGYGRLRAARFLLLGFGEPDRARPWLGSLAPAVTRADADPREAAVHIAFTPFGLRALGVDGETMAGFSNEFREGMTTPHRQRMLGDEEGGGPDSWRWGGPRTPPVDAVLMLYAVDTSALDAFTATHAAALATAGIELIATLDTSNIGDSEHFGFRDGISQPVVDGMGREGPASQTIRPGEFVLGYSNEYGLITDRPLVKAPDDPAEILPRDSGRSGAKDFGRNGSYLVIRTIEQDVSKFWRSLDELSSHDPDARLRIAAKMVGRWPGGAPLALSPDHDDPALSSMNDFGYHREDIDGLRCPVGAHVRRANPRDSLDPNPGSEGSISLNKRHRMLRRGRAYGPRLSIEEALRAEQPDEERGLHFACLVGNIARQFEFIQHTWANNPKFDGLYDEVDPLIGPRGPEGATFAIPATPVRERINGLPPFVTVRGGAYFFMPGIRALHYLAALS